MLELPFSWKFLIGTFKMIEDKPTCRVFTEVFVIARILHSRVLIHFGPKEKAIL